MANLLDGYPDTTSDEVTAPVTESTTKTSRGFAYAKKRENRALKELVKYIRRQNKLLKLEIEQRKAAEKAAAEKAAAEEAAAEKVAKRKNKGDEKGFWGSLGKAIGKALPQIVTAVVTGILGFFFKRKSSGKALQAA